MRKNIEISEDKINEFLEQFYGYFESGYAFEEFLKGYLEKIGLDEVVVTQRSSDGGIDLEAILEEDDLLQVFSLVNNYLDPGGIFIFDLNTVYKYQEILGEQTIAEDREECSFIWDNFYDEEEMINEYDLTVFVQEEGDLFRRYCETHYQRAYSSETVRALIEKAGMEVLAIYDAFTYNKPKPDSERVYFVAREHGKKTV